MSLLRINKELSDHDTSKNNFIIHRISTYELRCAILGEENTPYAGGVFWLSMKLPERYPFKPPRVLFITKIFHPNVSNGGGLDLDILGSMWSPALTIMKIIHNIIILMRDPNVDCPLSEEAFNLYKKSKEEFETVAKEHTRKFACPETKV